MSQPRRYRVYAYTSDDSALDYVWYTRAYDVKDAEQQWEICRRSHQIGFKGESAYSEATRIEPALEPEAEPVTAQHVHVLMLHRFGAEFPIAAYLHWEAAAIEASRLGRTDAEWYCVKTLEVRRTEG